MDWTGAHGAKLDCYHKTFERLDEEGNLKVVKGFPKLISGRKSLAMELKNFYGKSCRVYANHVLEATENEDPRLEDLHVLQEFRNFFLDEILELPPKSDIDFTVEIAPGKEPVSKTPYRMSTPKMLELKLQIQELLEKK